jgi:hypothetical protein
MATRSGRIRSDASTAFSPETLLFGLFQVWRLRYRGRRRLTARPDGAVLAVERGVTDNHGHTQWPMRESCSTDFTPSMVASSSARLIASKPLVILRSFIDIVAFCRRDALEFSVPSVYYRAADAAP